MGDHAGGSQRGVTRIRVVDAYGYQLHLRRRSEDRPPRRRVIERTPSWFHRARRPLVRWEKQGANYLAFLHLSCALTTLSVTPSAGQAPMR